MSERFLKALFAKLKPKDFNRTPFLQSFYTAAVKENVDLYSKFIEYLMRNKSADQMDTPAAMCDKVYKNILGDQAETAFSKTRALDALSEALESSSVTVDNDPYQQNTNTYAEEFDENTHTALLQGVATEVKQDHRVIPAARPDLEFAARSERLKLYSINRIDLNEMKPRPEAEVEQLTAAQYAQIERDQNEKKLKISLLSKMYLVDAGRLANGWANPGARLATLETVPILTDGSKPEIILPAQRFAAEYKPPTRTTLTLSANTPLNEAVELLAKKKRILYICAGSANVCGGVDHGNECQETALYARTTYPLAIETALYAYPLKPGMCALCPNVLIIKDRDYKPNTHNKYQRVAVMMAPAPYRPKTTLLNQDLYSMDERLYSADVKFNGGAAMVEQLSGYIEAALFFGYTNLILDDRGICENWLPAHAAALAVVQALKRFNGRIESVAICVPNLRILDIYKIYAT